MDRSSAPVPGRHSRIEHCPARMQQVLLWRGLRTDCTALVCMVYVRVPCYKKTQKSVSFLNSLCETRCGATSTATGVRSSRAAPGIDRVERTEDMIGDAADLGLGVSSASHASAAQRGHARSSDRTWYSHRSTTLDTRRRCALGTAPLDVQLICSPPHAIMERLPRVLTPCLL